MFRWLIAASVVLAIAYTGYKTSDQLHSSDFNFRDVNWWWCVASIAIYISAMSLSWMFWHRVLSALGQSVPRSQTLLAFFASQLGKYVPGKALVVIIRTDLVRGFAQTRPAAASVFVETLTWLFVGSAIGCGLLTFQFREQTWLLAAAAGLTLVAGALTSPPVFRRVAERLGVARESEVRSNGKSILSGLDWPTMGFGWLVMSLGWCLNGFSLWLVLKGIGAEGLSLNDFPLTLACVCLATVAGFVSLLPGGLGVRELVMIPLLGARFGTVTAVVAAILIRLVWLAAELLTSAIIYGSRRVSS